MLLQSKIFHCIFWSYKLLILGYFSRAEQLRISYFQSLNISRQLELLRFCPRTLPGGHTTRVYTVLYGPQLCCVCWLSNDPLTLYFTFFKKLFLPKNSGWYSEFGILSAAALCFAFICCHKPHLGHYLPANKKMFFSIKASGKKYCDWEAKNKKLFSQFLKDFCHVLIQFQPKKIIVFTFLLTIFTTEGWLILLHSSKTVFC